MSHADSAENRKALKKEIDLLIAVQVLKILTPAMVRTQGGRMSKKRWEMLKKI